MKHAASRELFAYWTWLRAGRAAPDRADIDPACIRTILADTFMVEVGAGQESSEPEMPIRLSGTRVNALFGEDIRGWSFPSLWRNGDRGQVTRLLDEVMDGSSPAIVGSLAGPEGQAPLSIEILLLPLRFQGKTHARFFGALSLQALPLWLGLRPVRPLTLTSQRFLGPADEVPDWAPAAPPAGMPMPPRPRQVLQRHRTHLVVYEGGKSDRLLRAKADEVRPR